MSDRKNNLAILSGSILTGTALGSCNYYRIKQNFNKNLKDIDIETEKKYQMILNDIFEDCKNDEFYKEKIDAFEKENKIFNKDFFIEEILKEKDLEDFKTSKQAFWNNINNVKDEAIKAFKKSKYLTKNIILGGSLGAIVSGVILLAIRRKGNENPTNNK